MKIGKYKVVRVGWLDAASADGWRKGIEGKKNDVDFIQSVGILVSKTNNALTLSTSISQWGNFVDQITIPARAIIKVQYL